VVGVELTGVVAGTYVREAEMCGGRSPKLGV